MRPQLEEKPTKCKCCNKILTKRKTETEKAFTRRKFCNTQCAGRKAGELHRGIQDKTVDTANEIIEAYNNKKFKVSDIMAFKKITRSQAGRLCNLLMQEERAEIISNSKPKVFAIKKDAEYINQNDIICITSRKKTTAIATTAIDYTEHLKKILLFYRATAIR